MLTPDCIFFPKQNGTLGRTITQIHYFHFILFATEFKSRFKSRALKWAIKSFGREFWSDFILGNELNPACAANSVDFDP